MKKILLLLVTFYCIPLFSQEKSIKIMWGAPQTYSADSYSVVVPTFAPEKNFSFDMANGIHFVEQWQVNGFVNESSLELSNVVYFPIAKSELKNLDLNSIPENITASLKNGTSRDVNYAVLSLSPIIKQGSSYKKVVSFNVSYDMNVTSNYRRSANQMITNSVLTNGDWYKFEVEKSGVHKISKSFLNQMGINLNNFDPRNIKLFGNGGQMMPFANDANFPFDPTENAIKIIGEDDGVFNDSDYILFYAQGPSADVNVSYINTNINPYTDKTVYYINISSGQGKRIQNFTQPSGSVTTTIDAFQDYQFHEIDASNIIFVGRRWFGEQFGVENSQSFDFEFPNLVTSESVKIKAVTATTSSSASRFLVSVNSNALGSVSLSATNTTNGVYVTGGTFDQTTNVVDDNISVTLDYDNQGNPSAEAYLDYISVEATRALAFNGSQFHFRNNEATSGSGIANYVLSNASQVQEVWDVSDLYDVSSITNIDANNTLSFNASMGDLKTFITVSSQHYLEPVLAQNSTVNNQNLKGTIFLNNQGGFQDIDYLMLTTQSHLAQAQRLAQINRDKKNLNVKVVVVDDIYTEFSSGNPDITGIRNFVKYVYDNASAPENRVKYLCIFGDSSFDYKGRISSNTYNFPTWNAYSSFNLSSSFISDDYYAYVDLDEGVLDQFNNANKLDIAVGRIIADSPQRAKQMVDKIEVYYSKGALGSWRNNFIVVSDDVDEAWEATLQQTTDEIADEVTLFKPFVNVTKIHSDAYEQQASAGGDRYPGVTEALTNAIEKGALMVNYFGHGGEDGLAHERIFQKDDAAALNNVCKLNLFVTVTCEFTRFDNPLRETAGELIYWNKDAGSIALITTTRQIFVEVGKDFNKILKEYLFSYSINDTYSDYEYPTIAEALRLAKNDPSFSDAQKSLAFYIGDPALTLAFPEPNIRLTTINDVPITQETDVLQALGYAKLAGEITDVNGNVLNGYNGIVTTTIYDKEIARETLANDNTTNSGGLIKLNYTTLGAIVFRGQATVTNGQFEFDFIVPKDIGIPVGTGKISFYATQENALEDKTGASIEVLKIGGINPNAAEDNIGPTIQLYMNDEAFVSGGITNESPLLLANFEDENGINTASGIGHDIVALLDGDEVNPYVLNDYYLTEVDDYTKGALSFPFRNLEPGLHTLTLKAWDVYNNSATAEIQFIVFNENESLVINNVLNYPNPFVNYTEFWFSHNSSEVLDISVQIFTVSGKLVRTLNGQTALAGGKSIKSTSRDIVWDGRDDFGEKIGKGTYIYKLKVHSQSTNKSVEKIEKLVIL
ncbi:type IX secretion system sortase PorU [Olleya sp. Bg11-27]|uniref:type IX secretion system sortase PorU n=1 Tax=Olleya sp. Bg11-27 TaxID=2058135 RepID=UPI000C2FFEEB|nr:type IX secretion system sortase PorU [Olleya sp. Bg11-27]AUC77695.1 peptidase C25 [Olleya sp. Bg11-27]